MNSPLTDKARDSVFNETLPELCQELEKIALEALAAFRVTQNLRHYPKDHWSHRLLALYDEASVPAPYYWGADGRCIHCGAGDDTHHNFTCPTNLHPDKRAEPPPAAKLSPLAKAYCNLCLPLKVCHSAAGYYIGSWDAEGPVSRDSQEYYATEQLAQAALDNNTFTQRLRP